MVGKLQKGNLRVGSGVKSINLMKEFVINSRVGEGRKVSAFSQDKIKIEPMLWQCDREHAEKFGGEITKLFLDSLPDRWKSSEIRVDSRVHMLMPGFYPCIPGFHHDDVPREREDGQPNYTNPSYKAEHVMAIFGDASITEFAIGESNFPDVPLGEKYYRVWNKLVEEKLKSKELDLFKIPPNHLIFFDWNSWHRGVAAHKNGWRFFIRATKNSLEKPKNEKRTQVQVYMDELTMGW